MLIKVCLTFILMFGMNTLKATPKSIRVFVALCDNATQGIVKVGARIGDGDKPDENLYWGCDDGLKRYFGKSKKWKLISKSASPGPVLETLEFTHTQTDLRLKAEAYRGSCMKDCLSAFEACVREGKEDLIAFIGHNGLMDFNLPYEAASPARKANVAVLCCMSEAWFKERVTQQGGRPLLMTTQLMYPGAFLLHDGIEAWRNGGDLAAVRAAAAAAYAKNQRISQKAALGIFSRLETK